MQLFEPYAGLKGRTVAVGQKAVSLVKNPLHLILPTQGCKCQETATGFFAGGVIFCWWLNFIYCFELSCVTFGKPLIL